MISAINIGKFYIRPYSKVGRKTCFVQDKSGKMVEVNIKSPAFPSSYYWYLEKDGEILGDIRCSRSSSTIRGDNYPDYYIGKESLFINSINSNGRYKGVGRELIKTAVQASQKHGMDGRVCLTVTTTKPDKGNPIPFYYKMGFESSRKEFQRKIEKAMQKGEPIPKECESTTMFLPEDTIRRYLN